MLTISKMNDNNDTMDGRKGLGIFCYKVHYSIVLFESGLGCKCILQTLGKPLKMFLKSIIDMLRQERKWNKIKWSINTTKERKSMEVKR